MRYKRNLIFVVSLNSDVDYGVVVLKILFQGKIILVKYNDFSFVMSVRMAERSKALRSGRSPLIRAWVRIPLLTVIQLLTFNNNRYDFLIYDRIILYSDCY